MSADLKRIRSLGFDYVWVNPVFTPCQHNPIPNMAHRVRSPYAMQNETIYSRYGSEDMVKEYTKAAVEQGLTPMFDLVARHVAIDHRFVTGDKELLDKYQIDTRKWFKRHPNGNLVMHNMDENYHPLTANPWCDIATFNYDDPEIKEQVIQYFWKPFLKYNIQELGFRGIRIDAPAMVPIDVIQRLTDMAKEYCQESYGQDPITIAETIGRGYMEDNLRLKDSVTHTMNSVFWMPGPEGGYGYDYDLWQQDDTWFTQNKGLLQQVGPTIGYAGSHDEPRYVQMLKDKGVVDPKLLQTRMLEKLAVSAFASDGGWILQYGDEFGATKQVDLFNPTKMEYHLDPQLQTFDVSDFVGHVNQTIAHLPDPKFPEWSQRVFLDDHPELVVFLMHQGFGFEGESFVIVANTNPEKPYTLSDNDLQEIMSANGRNKDTSTLPKKIYMCGAVTAHRNLFRQMGETAIFRSQSSSQLSLLHQKREPTPTIDKGLRQSPH